MGNKTIVNTENFTDNGIAYIKDTRENGSIQIVPKPQPIMPKPTPEYVTLLENENKATIKTGVLTLQERDKLLVAIALKLRIL